jgi:hypothetical protein
MGRGWTRSLDKQLKARQTIQMIHHSVAKMKKVNYKQVKLSKVLETNMVSNMYRNCRRTHFSVQRSFFGKQASEGAEPFHLSCGSPRYFRDSECKLLFLQMRQRNDLMGTARPRLA